MTNFYYDSLSFDGKGVNDTDEHRTRLATFNTPEHAARYGELFANAPDILQALKDVLLFRNSPQARLNAQSLINKIEKESGNAKNH